MCIADLFEYLDNALRNSAVTSRLERKLVELWRKSIVVIEQGIHVPIV